MKINPLVIKLGGFLLDSDVAMDRFFNVLSKYLESIDYRSVLIVHGGGRLVNKLMNRLKLPINYISGLRVTPKEHINIIAGVLSGTVNKILLSWAKRKTIKAVGLCLSDGNSLEINQLDKNLGHVGFPKPGSSKFLKILFKKKMLPIISSIGITKSGLLMNVNADLAATSLAIILKADLILLSDVSAILDGKGQRITEITEDLAKRLIKEGIITNGMIVKVNAALEASRSLGRSIRIAGWQNSKELELLFNGGSVGTKVVV